MEIAILKLTSVDLGAVDVLMKRYSGTIGFLPQQALEHYLKSESVLGAKTHDGRLVGYLLYAAYHDRFRVAQLCVSENLRGQGIAKKLVEALKATATTQTVMRLSCRNDFPAHRMWPKLGFVPLEEKPGRSKERHPLTLWRLALALDDQIALFRANVSDDILDVIIDAQIFFDFDKPNNYGTMPSKTLLSDFFVDSLNLWITDELFTEIGRNKDPGQREDARQRARQFLQVKHDPTLVDGFSRSLKQVLQGSSPSQLSDINHLSKAASSDVRVFVTKDRGILKEANQIAALTNLRVLSPTELVIELRELSEGQAYIPDRVSGLGLQWRRLTSNEFASFPFTRFLSHGEKLSQLREKLGSLLADPAHEIDVLWSGDHGIALRAITYGSKEVLTVSLIRVANPGSRSMLGRFLIADVVHKAVQKNLDSVRIESESLPLSMVQGLSEMGFTKFKDSFVRFCFTRYLERDDTLSRVAELLPESSSTYRNMSHLDLERHCSPLVSATNQKHFLIPIRQGYALNLVDRQRSSSELFGGDPELLLRWCNVYYRKVTHWRMLEEPGRILWYVSGDQRQLSPYLT